MSSANLIVHSSRLGLSEQSFATKFTTSDAYIERLYIRGTRIDSSAKRIKGAVDSLSDATVEEVRVFRLA